MRPEPATPWRDDAVTTAACAACMAFQASGPGKVLLGGLPAGGLALATWRGGSSPAQGFIGERRCPECNLFNRRVDLGGYRPHCDEPVAITDLTEGR